MNALSEQVKNTIQILTISNGCETASNRRKVKRGSTNGAWIAQPTGREIMGIAVRASRIFHFLAAVGAIWLCAGQPARAGDGADLAALQNYINDVCFALIMSTCPQIPTITAAVLQVAAFANVAPEAVRASAFFAIPVAPYVDAGNPSHPPGLECLGTGCVDPLNPITFPIDPSVLSSLRPLAFKSAAAGKGPATPTQLYDPSADSFLYVAGGLSAANKGSSQPDTIVIFYDDPMRTNQNLPSGQVVAKFSLPLTVLNSDGVTERQVAAVLQFKPSASSANPCSASTIMGDFTGSGTAQSITPPTNIGVNCGVVFAPSPLSSRSHAIFEISVPMLITSATDPVIIDGSPILGAPFFGIYGFPGGLSPKFPATGIGPNAGPAPSTPLTCDQNGNCTYPPASAPAFYALCADLPVQGNGQAPVPSIAAFYSIAGDGEVLASAPLAPSISIACPSGL
jgi:hypothetical protein